MLIVNAGVKQLKEKLGDVADKFLWEALSEETVQPANELLIDQWGDKKRTLDICQTEKLPCHFVVRDPKADAAVVGHAKLVRVSEASYTQTLTVPLLLSLNLTRSWRDQTL